MAIEPMVDLETRATVDDHEALRLWLRLLSCTVRVENLVRARLRKHFETTLPRFDLMAQLERYPDGLRMSDLSKRLMVSGGVYNRPFTGNAKLDLDCSATFSIGRIPARR